MTDPNDRDGVDAERPPRQRSPQQKGPRWGVRTVWTVIVATLFIVASDRLGSSGSDWAVVATVGAWLALASAAYCTYRGLRGFSWLPR
jgi:hypothetical protein